MPCHVLSAISYGSPVCLMVLTMTDSNELQSQRPLTIHLAVGSGGELAAQEATHGRAGHKAHI